MELELRINGVIADRDVAPGESLLSLLRREGYASVKHGCETGECGACTVLVDGLPRPSCVMLAAQAGGCALTTAESLGSADALHPLQQAFIDLGAALCGFCSSGLLLSASALLKANPSPTAEQVRDALSGHLCRCVGYTRAVEAVLRAAALLRGEKVAAIKIETVQAQVDSSPATQGGSEKIRNLVSQAAQSAGSSGVTTKMPVLTPEMLAQAASPEQTLTPANGKATTPRPLQPRLQVVGQSLPATHAVKMVTGKPVFAADVQPRGLLHARLLTSPHAHAVIRDISVAKAQALPGVQAILTYKDISRLPFTRVEARRGEASLLDQYSLDYIVRFVGDRVAVVVAETPEVAEQALHLIEVDYEVQPAIFDVRQATDGKAPRVHPEAESQGIHDVTRNIAARVRAEAGDVEQGFAQADQIIEAEYVVPATHVAAVENDAVLTYLDDNNVLVVRTNSQIPQYVRRTLAHLLQIPLRRVRVEMPSTSAPGARQHLLLEDLCAMLTLTTKRPVKLALSRAETMSSAPQRKAHIVRLKTGVKRDGTIVANQMIVLADTGAFATHPLASGQQALSALALYPCASLRYAAEVVYTHSAPSVAAAGQELIPEFFALESHIDEIARQLRMDALTLRRKNWLQAGEAYPFATEAVQSREQRFVVESSGLASCLQLVAEKLAWSEKRGKISTDRFRHGVGLALCYYGQPALSQASSGAIMKLGEDGTFDLLVSRAEDGSGLTTSLTQFAAEVLGVAVADVSLIAGDTSVAPAEVYVDTFSALYVCGSAVKKAAEQMRRQMLAVAGRMLNTLPEALKLSDGVIKNAQGRQVTLAQVAVYALTTENRQLMTTASGKYSGSPLTFGVQGVEIELDMETGGLRVVKAVTAIDVGKAMNPLLLEAAIEGETLQGLGLGLSEELFFREDGTPLVRNLQDYHVLANLDVPALETYLVESESISDIFGVKSATTVPLFGMAPALANAVMDAANIRIRHLPITPERTLRAIHALMAKR